MSHMDSILGCKPSEANSSNIPGIILRNQHIAVIGESDLPGLANFETRRMEIEVEVSLSPRANSAPIE